MPLCAGVDGAAVSGPPSVCGSSQLSMDGSLALSHDAGLTHSYRPEHAARSESSLQGNTISFTVQSDLYLHSPIASLFVVVMSLR